MGFEFSEPKEAQIEAAEKAFKANKNLKVVYATEDNQVFESFDYANAHSRDINNRDIAKIEKSEKKEGKTK